jgi:opacity protein-like surface antigen
MRRITAAALILAATTAAAAAALVPPPAGAKKLLEVAGDGVQIYACAEAAGKYTWAFKGPDANLYDAQGRQVGTHFAGPSWKLDDGSMVTAETLDKADAPRGAGVQWLLLKVKSHSGSGALDAADLIRRADTRGGLAPKTGCDAAHVGATARMHNTATYQFFAAPK